MRTTQRSILAMVLLAATVSAAQPAPAIAGVAAVSVVQPTAGSALPPIAAVAPARGQVVGVAHPVVVTFTGSVADRRSVEHALSITATPAMTGQFEWLDAATVQWVPDHFWPAHHAVALSVGGLATEFHTGPAVVGVADISEHTFTVHIDGIEAGQPAPSLPSPHYRPHFGEEGVLPASLGREEYATPVGRYTVLAKNRSVTMDSSSVGIPVDAPDGYLLKADYAVRITRRGIFVHSAPWAVNSMGIENVSHGCISLSPADAEWYFNAVNIGDPVIVQE